MTSFLRVLICILASSILSVSASAYEIGSGGSVDQIRKHDIHEVITELALECVQRSQGEPTQCSDLHPQIEIRSKQDRPADTKTLTYATRWPDDPQRTLNRTSTQLRFGLSMAQDCEDELAEGESINFTGLLCASHFGKLQFMHAMLPPSHPQEFEDQRQLILSWASFAFRAGVDKSFIQSDYCETVQSLSNEHLKEALKFDNAESPRSFCFERPRRFLFIVTGTYQPWTVASLFSFSCRRAYTLKRCGTLDIDAAQIAAQGAVLHLIQDSFSQSHASRRTDNVPLPPHGPFVPAIVCEPASQFYVYQDQIEDGDRHGSADKKPVLDAGCVRDDRLVDDVITASAKAIYFMQNADFDGFDAFMASRVFPVPR